MVGYLFVSSRMVAYQVPMTCRVVPDGASVVIVELPGHRFPAIPYGTFSGTTSAQWRETKKKKKKSSMAGLASRKRHITHVLAR